MSLRAIPPCRRIDRFLDNNFPPAIEATFSYSIMEEPLICSYVVATINEVVNR